MSAPHVAVVGGGLAGLRAAVSCLDAGARVTLLEARPRLGGATWSNRHQGLVIDNGQHVFLRCFKAYRDFVRRLGAEDRVYLQDRLALPVAAPGRPHRLAAAQRVARAPAPGGEPAALLPSRSGRAPAASRARATAWGACASRTRASTSRASGAGCAPGAKGQRALEVFWDLLVRPTLNVYRSSRPPSPWRPRYSRRGCSSAPMQATSGGRRCRCRSFTRSPRVPFSRTAAPRSALGTPLRHILPGAAGRHVLVTDRATDRGRRGDPRGAPRGGCGADSRGGRSRRGETSAAWGTRPSWTCTWSSTAR